MKVTTVLKVRTQGNGFFGLAVLNRSPSQPSFPAPEERRGGAGTGLDGLGVLPLPHLSTGVCISTFGICSKVNIGSWIYPLPSLPRFVSGLPPPSQPHPTALPTAQALPQPWLEQLLQTSSFGKKELGSKRASPSSVGSVTCRMEGDGNFSFVLLQSISWRFSAP